MLIVLAPFIVLLIIPLKTFPGPNSMYSFILLLDINKMLSLHLTFGERCEAEHQSWGCNQNLRKHSEIEETQKKHPLNRFGQNEIRQVFAP